MNPLVGMVLLTVIVIGAITFTLDYAMPTVDRIIERGLMDEADNNLASFDTAIKEVSAESLSSKRSLDISVSNGEYLVVPKEDKILFTYEENEKELSYDRINLIGNLRLVKGNYRILIINEGFDYEADKPFINLTINITGAR